MIEARERVAAVTAKVVAAVVTTHIAKARTISHRRLY